MVYGWEEKIVKVENVIMSIFPSYLFTTLQLEFAAKVISMIGYLFTDISLVVSVHRKMGQVKSRKISETKNGKLEISESYLLSLYFGLGLFTTLRVKLFTTRMEIM